MIYIFLWQFRKWNSLRNWSKTTFSKITLNRPGFKNLKNWLRQIVNRLKFKKRVVSSWILPEIRMDFFKTTSRSKANQRISTIFLLRTRIRKSKLRMGWHLAQWTHKKFMTLALMTRLMTLLKRRLKDSYPLTKPGKAVFIQQRYRLLESSVRTKASTQILKDRISLQLNPRKICILIPLQKIQNKILILRRIAAK